MDWLGIGVLLIGIALLVLVILLIKPLNKVTALLDGVQKTTDQLPNSFTDMTKQATTALQSGNEAIKTATNQVKELNPLFQIGRDVGEASQQLTEVALEKTMSLKQTTTEANEFAHRKQYEGLFGLLSFIFYFTQKKKEIKNELAKFD